MQCSVPAKYYCAPFIYIGATERDESMNGMLHLIGGDCAGAGLAKSGIPGEVFVWHDILYDGPRKPGWPDDDTLQARALFLEGITGGGLKREQILETLRAQYRKIETAGNRDGLVLRFDACL